MTDRDVDSLPTSRDPSGPCPRCGRTSNFQAVGEIKMKVVLDPRLGAATQATIEKVTALRCAGCNMCTLVVEHRDSPTQPFTPVMWWPVPGSVEDSEESIPADVARALSEGVRCLAVEAPNAGAAALRSALALVVADRGSEAARGKRNLKDAVKQMVADGSLWPTFGEWADHIRELGNAGAHPEIFGEVTMDEAKDLLALVSQLLEILYVQPAKISRVRSARSSGPTA